MELNGNHFINLPWINLYSCGEGVFVALPVAPCVQHYVVQLLLGWWFSIVRLCTVYAASWCRPQKKSLILNKNVPQVDSYICIYWIISISLQICLGTVASCVPGLLISDAASCLDVGMEKQAHYSIWTHTSWKGTEGDINLILSVKEIKNQLIFLSTQAQHLHWYILTKGEYNKNV